MNFSSQIQSQMENEFNPFDHLPDSPIQFQSQTQTQFQSPQFETQPQPEVVPNMDSKPEASRPQPKKTRKAAPQPWKRKKWRWLVRGWVFLKIRRSEKTKTHPLFSGKLLGFFSRKWMEESTGKMTKFTRSGETSTKLWWILMRCFQLSNDNGKVVQITNQFCKKLQHFTKLKRDSFQISCLEYCEDVKKSGKILKIWKCSWMVLIIEPKLIKQLIVNCPMCMSGLISMKRSLLRFQESLVSWKETKRSEREKRGRVVRVTSNI